MTENGEKLNKVYKHYVSLGYFCSVALDLERLGLRDASYPLDWCITDLQGGILALEKHFEGLLDYELLSQSVAIPDHYRNDRYGIHFFHDFNRFEPLSDQLPSVRSKYERRIERFYRDIQEPTLFIRYILQAEDGSSAEMAWAEEHREQIEALIKSFHPENEIIYIANEGLAGSLPGLYYVPKDPGDTVSRTPLTTNKQLQAYFETADYPKREANLNVYRLKKKKQGALRKGFKKLKTGLKRRFHAAYIHEKRYG